MIVMGGDTATSGHLFQYRRSSRPRRLLPIAVGSHLSPYRVDSDSLFVEDGRFITGARISAGIHLGLALVESDYGPDVARPVARWMVVFLQRPGGQAQSASGPSQHCRSPRGGARYLMVIVATTSAMAGRATSRCSGPAARRWAAWKGTAPARPKIAAGPAGTPNCSTCSPTRHTPEHEHMRSWVGNRLRSFDRAATDYWVRRVAGELPESVRLLLDFAADGIKLTPGGRLPRTVVRSMQQHHPHWHPLGRPAATEDDLPHWRRCTSCCAASGCYGCATVCLPHPRGQR